MGKRILKVVAFCMLLFGVVAGISRLVERKESRQKMQPFLDRTGEYDVLFLGDSIMNTGVFPMEMWEKYGIAGYNIATRSPSRIGRCKMRWTMRSRSWLCWMCRA